MKTLSLTQPWATLVAIGAKRVETRSWNAKYSGPLAIHAAKSFPGWAKDCCSERVFLRALGWPTPSDSRVGITQDWMDLLTRNIKALPLGCVIGTVTLLGCRFTEDVVGQLSEQEVALGDYARGRYAWMLADAKLLPEPIPAKGSLGLWDFDGITR